MVRKYSRKTTRQSWDEQAMKLALEQIEQGMPYKTAARTFSLPLSTLKRRAKGQNKIALGYKKCLGRYVTTLPVELEKTLKEYLLEMEDRLLGLTKKELCLMAYELAERNGISHRFSNARKAAGSTWFVEFIRRHPELSFRTPEATSVARFRGFNKEAVKKFFKILDEAMNKYNIHDPTKIYNMDESNIQTVPSKLPKVVAHRGRKQVGALTSAERGQSVTIALCMNAAGQYIPPEIIFPRKRRNEFLFQGVPFGTLGLQNESGYQKSDTFVAFLRHFHKHVRSTLDERVILLIDGHTSHKSLEALEFCRENGIVLIFFHLMNYNL